MTARNSVYAKAYYQAMGEKKLSEVEKYLHPDVLFIGPFAEMTGKKAVLEAISGFQAFFTSLTIRTTFDSGDQVALVYDVDFPAPIGIVRSVALMNFKDGLITRIELFFDARPFEKK